MFIEFFESIFKFYTEGDQLRLGYITGAVISLTAVLMVKVLFSLFSRYPKRALGINIKGDNGDIFISSNAIINMIRKMEPDFKFIKINKLQLMDYKNSQKLLLKICYDTDGGHLPSLIADYQSMILDKLNSVFGINSITEINFRDETVAKSKITKDSP